VAQLVGFFQQFLEVFSELKGKKFYIAGESVSTSCIVIESVLTTRQYAGMYVSCKWYSKPRCSLLMLDKDLANFIYEHTTSSTLDLDLRGIWMNDRELLLRFDLKSCSYLA
jgi:carboxypeptidase D